MIKYDSKRALELLRLGTNDPNANFREGQEEAIKRLIVGNSRLLIVQKTGWGKSFVYFIATKLLREAGLGPVLLFSPLLALMRNQLEAAKKIGVRAFTINCTNSDNWEEIETKIKKDEVDILLVSPERLSNERFQQGILSRIAGKVSMLVVDEAHCISDWGHDFRPHYRMIGRMVKGLPANMRVLATTATANDRVMEDLRSVLGKEIQVYRGDLNRENLILQTIKLNSKAGRLAWLAEKLPSISGSGIVYTLTIKEANLVASWLASRGLKSLPYSSESENREELEDALINDRVKVLVATSALGMGFDKPNISFVVHFQTPASVISYYQQVGRAGRKIPRAYGVLLVDEESFKIDNWFVDNAFPTSEEAQEVLDTLKRFPQGLSIKQMLPNINLPEGRIEKVLTLLSLESPAPVVKENGKWFLTIEEVKHEFWERIERIKKIKRKEIAQMKEYRECPKFCVCPNFIM
ncbi:RecQ family ATP-dependent DNA helicase [Turicimonas muris]|uniref:RecQ family ATP-dependent DNA helicase n=1 Tax=Turicimonas muris TaxID=1796652 RepID=UPI00272A7247|nr:RecQ family ATP-dependent DNA helicase [Turicimonas muris]